MVTLLTRSWAAWLLVAALGPAALAAEPGRSAREILGDLDAARMPEYDPSRKSERGYIEGLQRQFLEMGAKRDALILELFRVDPDHVELTNLMAEHWRRTPPAGPNERKLEREIADVLARTGNEKLKAEAYFARAQAGLYKSEKTGALDLSAVNEFVRTYPKDPRSEHLRYMATFATRDPKVRQALEDRVLRDYPESGVAEAILGARRQRAALGKPFELAFTDAISGSHVALKNWKGRVVVIDFWATWCGPCVAQMPHLKQLYARYHGRGLEIVGVSLDRSEQEGGLANLKQYVTTARIPWPQYYQGKVWDGEFSKSWGINALPAAFVIDTEGNLVAILGGEKMADQLEQIIPQLLEPKGRGATAPTTGG